MTKLDRTDARMLLAMCDAPRATGVQLAAALGLARNTVAARLARWDEERVLAPDRPLRVTARSRLSR